LKRIFIRQEIPNSGTPAAPLAESARLRFELRVGLSQSVAQPLNIVRRKSPEGRVDLPHQTPIASRQENPMSLTRKSDMTCKSSAIGGNSRNVISARNR